MAQTPDTCLPIRTRQKHKMMMTNKMPNKSNYDGVPEKSNLSRTATAAATSGCVNNHYTTQLTAPVSTSMQPSFLYFK